jgi:chromosome segregation protein
MGQTEQNLVRIRDRLRDREESLASLRRQAQKAERFRAYWDEQRGIDVHLAAHGALERIASAAWSEREREGVATALESERAAVAVGETRLLAERTVLEEWEGVVSGHQRGVWEIGNRIQVAEASMRAARTEVERLAVRGRQVSEQRAANRIGLERGTEELGVHRKVRAEAAEALSRGEERLEEIRGRLERVREASSEVERRVTAARATFTAAVGEETRLGAAAEATASALREREERRDALTVRGDELSRRFEALCGRSEGARSDLDGLTRARDDALQGVREWNERIEGLRRELARSDERLRERRHDHDLAESRAASLREFLGRHEAFGAGVRALLDPSLDGQAPPFVPLGDLVSCDEGYEPALAAVLGDSIQRLVCARRSEATDGLGRLRDGALGRAEITPRDGWRRVSTVRDGGLPDGARRLLDHVRADERAALLIEDALACVFVVGSLAEADILRASGHEGTFVTKAGEVLRADGTLCGGSAEDRFAPFLHARAESERQARGLPALERALEEARADHERLRSALRDAQERHRVAGDEAHRSEIEVARRDGDFSALQNERLRLEAEIEEARGERGRLEDAIAATRAEVERLRGAHAEAEARRAGLEAEAGRLAEELERAREEADRVGAEHAAEREAVAGLRARLAGTDTLIANLERRLEELRREIDLHESELDENARSSGGARGRIVAAAIDLEEMASEHRARGDALAMAQASFEAQRERIQEVEAELRGHRQALEAVGGRAAELRSQVEAERRELQFLAERLFERHEIGLDEAIALHHASPLLDENHRRRAEELRRLIERMGGVNLNAIEEYEECARTVEELTRQKDDLERALADLRTAIQRMNRESRIRFRAAFDAVNEQFQRLFPRMFFGGRAHLNLTDADDLLEAGVEIVAQPPGKSPKIIELLSGGEKALTAVCLIFALFLYKPSPFCVLDEVDAPLDEANVGRFCDLVHELAHRTQFVLVTHVKQTMERAEVLYGVTMEDPGVSKIVSVRLTDQRGAGGSASAA